MTSAAHDESYGNSRWRDRRHGPWGWGGWGCGWQQASWSGRDGEGSWSGQSWGPAWRGGHPFWGPFFIPKPLLIVATILGFMFWWPIGLALLFVTLCRRHMFYGYRHGGAWQGPGPGGGWKNWFGGGGGSSPSSGNRAFDEYRAETLRRLEEEQKEFAEFLERLRFAKDKSEFDQFMDERRNRPPGAPQEPPPHPAN